jgi:co-chaperonin GroES (HSP10)
MNVKMLGDRVLITPLPKEDNNQSPLLIISNENSVLTAGVVKVGTGVVHVQEQDKILYKEADTFKVNLGNTKYLIIREYDIIAVI